MTKNSINKGSDGNPFDYIETPTISNPFGPAVTFNDNVVFSNDYDVTFNEDVIANANIIPGTSFAHALGATDKYWLRHYVSGLFVNFIESVNPFISFGKTLIPALSTGIDLGAINLGLDNVFAKNIESPTGYDLNIDTFSSDKKIIVHKDVRPHTNNTIDLGQQSHRYKSVYGVNANFTNYVVDISTHKADLSFGPATITAGSPTKQNITVSNGPYKGTNHTIIFPTQGMYMIIINMTGDGSLTEGYLRLRFYRQNLGTYVNTDWYQQIGSTSAVTQEPTKEHIYVHHADSNQDELEIHIGTYFPVNPFPYDITNVKFREGTKIVKLQSY